MRDTRFVDKGTAIITFTNFYRSSLFLNCYYLALGAIAFCIHDRILDSWVYFQTRDGHVS